MYKKIENDDFVIYYMKVVKTLVFTAHTICFAGKRCDTIVKKVIGSA